MKIQIRTGLFETNSSSTHALTVCSESTYEDWKAGKCYYDTWDKEIVSVEKAYEWKGFERDKKSELYDKRFLTYDEYNKYIIDGFEDENGWWYGDYDYIEKTLITENGDKVIAFGYYGQDN